MSSCKYFSKISQLLVSNGAALIQGITMPDHRYHQYLKEVEIIEYHHPYKADAPSGTAIKTVDMMTDAVPDINAHFQDFKKTELIEGSKGGYYKNIPVHSVRLDSYIASQEVLLGSAGQRLSIRHDSIDRMSFMPGVCLSLKKAVDINGLVYGLENIL